MPSEIAFDVKLGHAYLDTFRPQAVLRSARKCRSHADFGAYLRKK